MNQPAQLRMRLDDIRTLPSREPPMGIVVRRAIDDDAESLAGCLSEAFDDRWDVVRVRSVLLTAPEVVSTWVAEESGKIVATASLMYDGQQYADAGILHWVGTRPAWAGRGLGSLVSIAALCTCHDLGVQAAVLLTDDHRLPAISTYRRLGFMPLPTDPSHPDRWRQVFARLP